MFSLREYVRFSSLDQNLELNPFKTQQTYLCKLCWTATLYPSIPLEKLFPFVEYLQNQTSIHPTIAKNKAYQHFNSVYSQCAQNVNNYVKHVNTFPNCLSLLESSLTLSHRSQRIIQVSSVQLNIAADNLIANELFFYASDLLNFHVIHNSTLILFHGVRRVQVLHSLVSFIENSMSFSKDKILILPYSTKAKSSQTLLALPVEFAPVIRHYLFCDWVSDSSSIRKNPLLVAPFICANFNLTDVSTFATVKTLLRWFCVSRSQYRGILTPNEPGFGLYRYLPHILKIFAVRRELSKYHTRNFISTNTKKIDNTVPGFLRGLKSFLQLKQEHFIDFKSLKHIHTYLHSHAIIQRVFPQVWDIVNHAVYKSKKTKISLNDEFVLEGLSYPSYMFLYAMMLHKIVPKKIKQMIWTHTYTNTPIILPSKLKGIEHLQRSATLYKNYNKYILPETSSKPQRNEFLQLLLCLEYRSYLNPSKLSFKISNIPSVKMDKRATNFPIMTVAKEKVTGKKNLVYSNFSWVVRNIECSSLFLSRRDFLVDQFFYMQLYNSI